MDEARWAGNDATGGDELAELMEEIRAEFIHDALERTARVAGMVAGLAVAEDPADLIGRVVREVHTLKGAAGTVGFPEISLAAGEAECLARQASAADGWPEGTTEAVAGLVEAAAKASRARAA